MAKKSKENKPEAKKTEPEKGSGKDYSKDYNRQTVSVSSHVVYNPPEGKGTEDHTGLPYCYSCCGTTGCRLSCLGLIAATVVCCAYVSQDGTCCTYCQWPF